MTCPRPIRGAKAFNSSYLLTPIGMPRVFCLWEAHKGKSCQLALGGEGLETHMVKSTGLWSSELKVKSQI